MYRFYQQLSSSDRKFIFWVIIGIVILSSVIYPLGQYFAGQNYIYTGNNIISAEDNEVYYSMIKQAEQGQVLLKNLFTGEPQKGSIFHPLWLVLGWLVHLTGLSIPFVFHLARVVLGIILLLYIYYFISQFIKQPKHRNIAFILIAFSSGLGAFFCNSTSYNPMTLHDIVPIDQWVAEGNTFLTLLQSPLFIISQLLLLVIFNRIINKYRYRDFIWTGGVLFFLVLLHPYDGIIVAAVSFCYLLVRILRHSGITVNDFLLWFNRLLILGLATIPVVLYYSFIINRESAVAGWLKQNITISPPIHGYIIGYGLLILFAIIGFIKIRRTRDPAWLFVLTWIGVSLVLLYIPIQINRRFSNGLHIAISLLAAIGLNAFWSYIKQAVSIKKWRRAITLGIITACLLIGLFSSNIVILYKMVEDNLDQNDKRLYISHEIDQAADWLENHTDSESVILADYYNGNVIPALTGRRVYLGHWSQTIDFDYKKELIESWFFYTNNDDEQKRVFLFDSDIDYVFFSVSEDALGKYIPADKDYLKALYSSNAVTIYQVIK